MFQVLTLQKLIEARRAETHSGSVHESGGRRQAICPTSIVQGNNEMDEIDHNTGASADAETGSREPGLASRPGPSGFDPARIDAWCQISAMRRASAWISLRQP
jgi:hypothetical protein